MRAALTLLVLLGGPCLAEKRLVTPVKGPKPVGPYSPGILAGDFLYVSGQGARGPDNQFAADFASQTRQCLRNVQAIVEGAGLTMEHIVYSQVYLADMKNYDTMNSVWREFFPKNPPARATLGVARMPTETPVEINAVALRDVSRKLVVNLPNPAATPPISHAVVAGDRIFVSGMLGWDAQGKVPADPATQVENAIASLTRLLRAAGADLSHLVFTNVYLDPAITVAQMNAVYQKYFEPDNAPARATIPVVAVPLGNHVEITGVAVRDLRLRRVVKPRNMPPSRTASPCVFAGPTLYCSAKAGFIPGPNSGIWADTVEHQLRQTMRNLLDGLEEAGLNFTHAVAANVYIDQLDEFSRMNAVYAEYFGGMPPTRTTVQPLPPVERKRDERGRFPKLEEVSIIAER